MQIKMNVSPCRYYNVVKRFISQEKIWEKRERYFNLRIEDVPIKEIEAYKKFREEKDLPTHRVFFCDFKGYQFIDGKIKENNEDKFILEVGEGKEYEFSSFFYPPNLT